MNMEQIKAIETVYDGVTYRSRLEARWAVFLDALGVEHEYESYTSKTLGISGYKPDFYLPSSDSFLEVKGVDNIAQIKRQDMVKIMGLATTQHKPVHIGYNNLRFSAMTKGIRGGAEQSSVLVECGICGAPFFGVKDEEGYCVCPHCKCGCYCGIPNTYMSGDLKRHNDIGDFARQFACDINLKDPMQASKTFVQARMKNFNLQSSDMWYAGDNLDWSDIK